MKTVYTNKSDIIHLFANRVEHNIRSSNMSVEVYEDISKLYSYNTVIAKHDKKANIFLLSTRNYSVTTSGQQRELRRAIWGDTIIYVYDVNNMFYQNIECFNSDILFNLKKESRARQGKAGYQNEIMSLIDNMQKYINYKKADLRKYGKYLKIKTFEDVISFYDKEVKKDEKQKEKEKKAREKQRKEEEKKKQQFIRYMKNEGELRVYQINRLLPKLFHSGRMTTFRKLQNEKRDIHGKLNENINYTHLFNHRDYLKVASGNVLTSQGVTIPKNEALRFYKLFKRKNLFSGEMLDGAYRVREVGEECITIGCHVVCIEEMEYIAKKLGV